MGAGGGTGTGAEITASGQVSVLVFETMFGSLQKGKSVAAKGQIGYTAENEEHVS